MPRPLFKTVSAEMHYFPWKSTFSNFSASNNRNESRWVNKNHFLSYALPIFLKVSKFKNWTHPLFKTVFAEKDYFASKTRFSSVSAIKADESIKTSTYHTLGKVSVWMHPRFKTVFAQTCHFIWKTTFLSFCVLKYS